MKNLQVDILRRGRLSVLVLIWPYVVRSTSNRPAASTVPDKGAV